MSAVAPDPDRRVSALQQHTQLRTALKNAEVYCREKTVAADEADALVTSLRDLLARGGPVFALLGLEMLLTKEDVLVELSYGTRKILRSLSALDEAEKGESRGTEEHLQIWFQGPVGHLPQIFFEMSQRAGLYDDVVGSIPMPQTRRELEDHLRSEEWSEYLEGVADIIITRQEEVA